MKKIIIALATLALALSAHAKDVNALLTEFKAITAPTSQELMQAQLAYVDANKADVITAFDAWKNTPQALFRSREEAQEKLGSLDKAKDSTKLHLMFARLYDSQFAVMDCSDAVAWNLGSSAVCRKYPKSWYEEIKANKWIIDGLDFSSKKVQRMLNFKDFDAFYALSYDDVKNLKSHYFQMWFKVNIKKALNAQTTSEIESAKALCSKIETDFILKQDFENPILKQVQAIGKALTSRLVDKKISGK